MTIIGIALSSMAGLGWSGFTLYRNVEEKLYEQKMATLDTTHKIETLTVRIGVVEASLAQLKAEQKETDNALRKSLDSIADDLLKVRISLASRGRTGMLCTDRGDCGTRTGFEPAAAFEAIDTTSNYPALNHKGIESVPVGGFD